jgi:diguanylate cyclase (GGDEF)-like protein/PAS domain S-box-containing protein
VFRTILRLVVSATERVADAAVALEEQLSGAPRAERPVVPARTGPGVDSLRTFLARALDGLVVLDESGTITYASPSFLDVLGVHEDLTGTDALSLVHPEDVSTIRGALATLSGREEGAMVLEFRAEHSDGTWRWMEARATNLLRDPEIKGLLMNVRDISERRANEDDLRHRALHDTLTGLPNRTLLLDRLRGAIGRTGRGGRKVAVFFLDLDSFKDINDTMGHAAGDEVLAGVGRRLAAVARTQDTVARYGGDEFVVVVEHDQDMEWVEEFADRLRAVFREPVQAGRRSVEVHASVGIASINGGNPTAEGLLRDADAAMYRAKQSGGDTYVVFDDSMVDQPFVDLTME